MGTGGDEHEHPSRMVLSRDRERAREEPFQVDGDLLQIRWAQLNTVAQLPHRSQRTHTPQRQCEGHRLLKDGE